MIQLKDAFNYSYPFRVAYHILTTTENIIIIQYEECNILYNLIRCDTRLYLFFTVYKNKEIKNNKIEKE